jgi:hypothetical protein
VTQIGLYLKFFGEVLAEFCFWGYGFENNFGSIYWLWSNTPSGQNFTKTLRIKVNLSHLYCLFPFSVSISHSMASLVHYSQNKQEMSSDIFRVYGPIITCFYAGNSLYALEYLFEAFIRIHMTLWHAEWDEQHYSTWSPQIIVYGVTLVSAVLLSRIYTSAKSKTCVLGYPKPWGGPE